VIASRRSAELEGEINMTAVRKTLVLVSVCALAAALGGCNKTAAGATDAASVESAIKADEKKWNEQFKSKDLEGLLSHYAADAYFVAPGAPAAKGSTEIRKLYAEALSDNYFSVSFGSDKIDVSGDLAYSRGHFEEKYQDRKSLQIVSDSGTYVAIYKKQPDGSWKVVEDIASPDPATRKETSAVAKPAKMISM
jgi:ketosteroid isomerase-like protein